MGQRSPGMTPNLMKTFEVNVVSIILSLLIARILYVFFDWVTILGEEVLDEEIRNNYHKSNCYLLNAVVSSLLCFFAFILIYEYYAGRHGLRWERRVERSNIAKRV